MTNPSTLSPTAPERRILTGGTFQARDAGRYPTADGQWMSGGLLFRSDSLSALTEEDLAELKSLDIRLVLDLREQVEADAAPDVLPDGVEYLRIPVFEETLFQHEVEAFPTLLGQYQLVLEHHAAKLVEVITAVAQADGVPVIVHCTAGKDRTGLVVALIQLVLGIDEESVLADFAASQIILGDEFDGAVRAFYNRAGLPGSVLGPHPHKAPPTYLVETLAEIRNRHGSVEDFLVEHGMRREDVAALRAALLTDEEIVSMDDSSSIPPNNSKENAS